MRARLDPAQALETRAVATVYRDVSLQVHSRLATRQSTAAQLYWQEFGSMCQSLPQNSPAGHTGGGLHGNDTGVSGTSQDA